jgi:hypothetical protein
MSRHLLVARPEISGRLEVTIGFDPPLSTFFLTVEDLDQEDDELRMRVWIGGEFKGVTDVEAIIAQAEPWAIIPEDLAGKLRHDLANKTRAKPNGPAGFVLLGPDDILP